MEANNFIMRTRYDTQINNDKVLRYSGFNLISSGSREASVAT